MLNLTSLLCNERFTLPTRRRGQGMTKDAKGVPIPAVVWAVTRASNLPCSYCDATAESTAQRSELSHAEGMALLKDLRKFAVPVVIFGGGEPLLRKDTLELIDEATQMGLACTLSTNGLALSDKVADRLTEVGVKLVSIPLEGGAATHDALRKKPGAHAAALAAIDRCRRRGVKVAISYTLTAKNRGDLGVVFDECVDHDVNRLTVRHLPKAPAKSGGNGASLNLSAKETRLAMDELFVRTDASYLAGSNLEVCTVGNTSDAGYMLLFLQKHEPSRVAKVRQRLEAKGGNAAGRTLAVVDPVGNVHYDEASWEYSVGNVRETPFSKLWREAQDPRLAILRDRAAHLSGRCQSCQFIGVCNGNSRARAEAATGDWLGIDPACYLYETERFVGSN